MFALFCWLNCVQSDAFNDGSITVALGTNDDVARAAIYQTDGKLVVAGRVFDGTFNDFGIARFHPDGSLDTEWDSDGISVTRIGQGFGWAHAVDIDSQQRIIVAGRTWWISSYNFAVLRFTSSGALDTAFSNDGIISIDFNTAADFGRAVAVQSDDSVVVGGYAANGSNYDFALARLTATGVLDTSFDSDGKVTLAIGTGDDIAHSMLIDAQNGFSVISGYSFDGTNDVFAAAVFDTSGGLFTGFDVDGMDTWSLGSNNARAYGLTQRATNFHYIVSGRSNNGSNHDFHTVRWNDNGAQVVQAAVAVGTGADISRAIAIEDSDGSMVSVGRVWNGSDFDFGASRIRQNTALVNTNFSNDGVASFAVGTSHDDAYSIAYENGKIAAVGRVNNASNWDFGVVRIQSNGTLATAGSRDEDFSGDGAITIDFNSQTDIGRGIRLNTTNEKIAIGGSARSSTGNDFYELGAVVLKPDGLRDTTFTADGTAFTDMGNNLRDEGYAVAVDSSGRVVVVGYTENISGNADSRDMAIAAWTETGILDTSFSNDGRLLYDFNTDQDEGRAVLIDSNNRILAAGFMENGGGGTQNFLINRYLVNGTLDTAFSNDGVVTTDFQADVDRTYGLAFSGNNIFAAGYTQNGAALSNDFAVAKYLADGTLDTSFSSDGRAFTDILANDDQANAVAADSSGGAVLVGVALDTVNGDDEYGIAKFTSSGILETAFSQDGILVLDNGGATDTARAVTIQPNGKIVVMGESDLDYLIVRLLPDGSQDTTFTNDGILVTSQGGNDDGYSITLTRDGRMVVGGRVGGNFGVLQLWP